MCVHLLKKKKKFMALRKKIQINAKTTTETQDMTNEQSADETMVR